MASEKAQKLVASWSKATTDYEREEVDFAIKLAILIQLENMTKILKDIRE